MHAEESEKSLEQIESTDSSRGSDLSGLKIALCVLGHDAIRHFTPVLASLCGVAVFGGLFVWSFGVLEKTAPETVSRFQLAHAGAYQTDASLEGQDSGQPVSGKPGAGSGDSERAQPAIDSASAGRGVKRRSSSSSSASKSSARRKSSSARASARAKSSVAKYSKTRRPAARRSYEDDLFGPSDPTGGRVVRSDYFITDYSWNR